MPRSKTISPSRLIDRRIIPINPGSVAGRRPDLLLIWNFEKNSKLGLDPYSVYSTDKRCAVWTCPTCHSFYDQCITSQCKSTSYECPSCRRIGVAYVPKKTAFDYIPDLSADFDYIRNPGVNVDEIYLFEKYKTYWWKCHKCGFEFQSTVSGRTGEKRADGTYELKPCPCCKGKILYLEHCSPIVTGNGVECPYLCANGDGSFASQRHYNSQIIVTGGRAAH